MVSSSPGRHLSPLSSISTKATPTTTCSRVIPLWHLLVLLCFPVPSTLISAAAVQTSPKSAQASQQRAQQVVLTNAGESCTNSAKVTFQATTEMVFEGRYALLTKAERGQLARTFRNVYNGITQRSCDSYFRRITNLGWASMSNNLGEFVVLDGGGNTTNTTTTNSSSQASSEGGGLRGRNLQATTTEETTNSSSIPTTSITYQVTGTCRDCPVSRATAFTLYDDSIRRALGKTGLGRGLRLRQLSTSTVTLSLDICNPNLQDCSDRGNEFTEAGGDDDCQCVEGTTPTKPQAPGVQECVDEMNIQLEGVRQTNSSQAAGDASDELFENITLINLLEFDEDNGISLVEDFLTLNEQGDGKEEDGGGILSLPAVDVGRGGGGKLTSTVRNIDKYVWSKETNNYKEKYNDTTTGNNADDTSDSEEATALAEAIMGEGMEREEPASMIGDIITSSGAPRKERSASLFGSMMILGAAATTSAAAVLCC